MGLNLWAENPPAIKQVEIDNVVWYYKPEQAFKRIGEYFDGVERSGRKVIIRSDPESREGLYFITRISEFAEDMPANCSFEVEIIRPDMKQPVSKIFPFPENCKSHREFWLGFTGDDVPADEEAPVAWRVRLRSPDGTVVATRNSFLWSKPSADEN